MAGGTAQLQGNIHMCPTSGKKRRGSYLSLAAALSQGFALAWTRLMRIPHTSCLTRIPDTSRLHSRPV